MTNVAASQEATTAQSARTQKNTHWPENFSVDSVVLHKSLSDLSSMSRSLKLQERPSTTEAHSGDNVIIVHWGMNVNEVSLIVLHGSQMMMTLLLFLSILSTLALCHIFFLCK